MPSLTIEDEVKTEPTIRVDNIPNPQNVYKEIESILTEKLGVSGSDIDEKMYEHSRDGDQETARSEITAEKSKDKFSSIIYDVDIDIEMRPVRKGEVKYVGDVEIELSAKVETEYPQDTPLEKSVFWNAFRAFYEKTLYKDQKEGYKKEATQNLKKLRREIQSFFDLMEKKS